MRPFFSNMTLGILAVILAAGILLISASFVMYGAATGLESVFVAQPWLAWVITGGVFLLGAILFLTAHFSKTKKVTSDFSKISGTLIQKILETTDGIDIKEWTRKHPYQSTGAAAAAGFIAAGKEASDITDIVKEVILPVLLEYLQSKQELD